MANKGKQIVAVLLATVMIFTLSACVVNPDFVRYGWDGVVDGEKVWENPNYTEEPQTTKEETTTSQEKESEEQKPTDEEKSSDKKDTTKKVEQKTNQQQTGTSSKSSSTNADSQQQQKPSSNNPSQQNTQSATKPATGEKQLTTTEIIDFYKNAANPIKTKSGVTVTRTREKYIELGGNLSGLSASIVKGAFSEKDDTKAVTYTSQSDIKSKFIVEKQSYVCNLTANDVKSATITKSGNNQVVTILVKDDVDQAQGYSNKAVSATAVSDLAVPLSLGKLKYMACKDVKLEATIDANGRLIALHTYMPAYFYSTDESFGVALEQWWSISYS